MKRRLFLKSSMLATALNSALPLLAGEPQADATKKGVPEFYEWRTYLLKNETQQALVETYLQHAAIPAWNRLGSKNIGVFRELKPEGQTKLFVLIPFASFDAFLQAETKLAKDTSYLEAGAAYLNAPATAPAYERMESTLLHAFAGMPKVAVPQAKPRIFELRRYESASEQAGKKKIEMFNDAGEIEVFKRVGLTPVFFCETLIGTLRPNLTYMLTFDDMNEHDRNWKAFGSDPEWKRISALPEYADAKIVSRITNNFLIPTDFSQI
jgi:hypothetical protein